MRVVAVFDFDGTLSTRDNVLPFLRAVAGGGRLAVALLATAPVLVGAVLRDARRDRAKAALVRRLLRGHDQAGLAALGERFADSVVANHLRPEVVSRVEWHRRQQHELVIVSASFDLYLAPVASRLGFDAALGVGLEVDGNGRLTGELDGPNVRRGEKVRRLDEWLGGRPAIVWAYGDSRGDRELLERADHAMAVTGRVHGRVLAGRR